VRSSVTLQKKQMSSFPVTAMAHGHASLGIPTRLSIGPADRRATASAGPVPPPRKVRYLNPVTMHALL